MKRLTLVLFFAGLAYLSIKNLFTAAVPQYILAFVVSDTNQVQMWYGLHFLVYMLCVFLLLVDFGILNNLGYFILTFHFVELGALYVVMTPQAAQNYIRQQGYNFPMEFGNNDLTTVVTMVVATAAVINAVMLYFFYAVDNQLE